jgi:hypothetical protein
MAATPNWTQVILFMIGFEVSVVALMTVVARVV